MIPADLIQLAISIVPAAIFVAILVAVALSVRSVATAEPGGLVPRTMDPTASWL